MNEVKIKPLFWLWIPILWMVGQLTAEALIPNEALLEFHRENGLHEWLQFAMLVAVFAISLRILTRMNRAANIWLTLWIGAAALGSFYVAAEEISWGQWVFHWQTPEEWAAINGQNETNLHNTSRWLNQIPRTILEVGILVGGIIIPAVRYLKPDWIPTRFNIIYPPNILAVTAIIAAGVKFSQKICKLHFDCRVFQRASEVEELYIFFFVLLYMIVLQARILNDKK
ncbi:MAG: hypothetical protein AAF204_00255 [Pseudomonadota bacterium]